MRHLKFLHFLLLITLCSCDSCREKDWTELPPETQTGANTFGCYVDGELFVNDNTHTWMEPSLNASFQKRKNLLVMHSFSKKNYIYVESKDPQINIVMPAFRLNYIPLGDKVCPNLGGVNIGNLILTKLDTISHIVSGRFQFPVLCVDSSFETQGDTIFNITDGRFDLKLKVYE